MSLTCRYRDNQIYNVDRAINEDAVEPWTLDEVKGWLTIDFSDDDTALTALIPQVRDAMEMFCNISMVSRTITLDGEFYRQFELPYGPVATITSVGYTYDGTTYTSDTGYRAIGPVNSYKQFVPSMTGMGRIVYTTPNINQAQYASLRLDGLRLMAYCWQNRGDNPLSSLQNGVARPEGLDQALELFARKYVRIWL